MRRGGHPQLRGRQGDGNLLVETGGHRVSGHGLTTVSTVSARTTCAAAGARTSRRGRARRRARSRAGDRVRGGVRARARGERDERRGGRYARLFVTH